MSDPEQIQGNDPGKPPNAVSANSSPPADPPNSLPPKNCSIPPEKGLDVASIELIREYFRTTRALIEALRRPSSEGLTTATPVAKPRIIPGLFGIELSKGLNFLDWDQLTQKDYQTVNARLKYTLHFKHGVPLPFDDGSDAVTIVGGNPDVLVSYINEEFFPQNFRFTTATLQQGRLIGQVTVEIQHLL
jgi:hypothetical protein